MKITKSQLKQIIKEELEEVLDDREVQVPGFARYTLSQVERKLADKLEKAGQAVTAARAQAEPDYSNAFYDLRNGTIQAFYKAYKTHKSEEQISEAEALSQLSREQRKSAEELEEQLVTDIKILAQKYKLDAEGVKELIKLYAGADKADRMAVVFDRVLPQELKSKPSALQEELDMESLRLVADVVHKMVSEPGVMLAAAAAAITGAGHQIKQLRKGK